MSTETTAAKNALEAFATHLESIWPEQSFSNQIGGWNTLPIRTSDMGGRVRKLASRLDSLTEEDTSSLLQRTLNELPTNIAWIQNNVIPQIKGGNFPTVLSNFDYFISNIEWQLPSESNVQWEKIERSNLVPRDLARKIRSIESAIARLAPRTEEIDAQVKVINEAHQSALDLPTDLQSLQEAREEIGKKTAEAQSNLDKSISVLGGVERNADVIAKSEQETRQLISNIEAAYSAATTKGLAGAFTERANSLTASTRYWVGLLSVALLLGAAIGYVRLDAFQALIGKPGVDLQTVWINAAMSLLAIAAPVWFAWLATRQIGQRFRLAEDYAFKASVARAYEGYRKEAARLDPDLEARLFASALDRLDEPPLRFLSTEEHGSPYESLLASAGFQKALEKIPSLRDAAAAALDRAGGGRNRVEISPLGSATE